MAGLVQPWSSPTGRLRGQERTPTKPTSKTSSTSSAASRRQGTPYKREKERPINDVFTLAQMLAGGGGAGGGAGSFSPSLMRASSVQIPGVNLPAAPSNPASSMMDAAKRAFQGQVDYAKSVIPYYEQREAASKGEIQDLRNIAQASWSEAGGTMRKGGAEASSRATQQTQDIMGTLEAGADTDTAALQAAVDKSGLGERLANVGENINTASTQAQASVGAEGSLAGELIASGTERAAGYADSLAALQDTAAAADIALLGQNINELIFRQQGRVAETQGQQAQAAMSAAIQGQQMYDQAYGRHAGFMMDAARMQQQAALQNAQFAQEANQYNAGALNAAAEAGGGGASILDTLPMAMDLYKLESEAGERQTPQEALGDYLYPTFKTEGGTQRRVRAIEDLYAAAMAVKQPGESIETVMQRLREENKDTRFGYVKPNQQAEWLRLLES